MEDGARVSEELIRRHVDHTERLRITREIGARVGHEEIVGGSGATRGWRWCDERGQRDTGRKPVAIAERATLTEGTGGGCVHGENSPLGMTPLRQKKAPPV
jgi:hypothetical protein